jgi:hypothetical protein
VKQIEPGRNRPKCRTFQGKSPPPETAMGLPEIKAGRLDTVRTFYQRSPGLGRLFAAPVGRHKNHLILGYATLSSSLESELLPQRQRH